MTKKCCTWRKASGDILDMEASSVWIETVARKIKRCLEQNNREKLDYWMEELECEVGHILDDWEIYRRKNS